MTPNQMALRRVSDGLDRIETRAAAILSGEVEGDTDAELIELAAKKKSLLERRTAIQALVGAEEAAQVQAVDGPDAEHRARLELRSRATLTGYLRAAVQGRAVQGAERELAEAAGIDDGSIPLEIWEVERRADAPTAAPSTTGITLDPVQPAVFAASAAASLGIAMPMVGTGDYATGTITTSLTAQTRGKGVVTDSTAATITVAKASPKRVSARMSIRIEDVASIGVENFESALRQNLQAVLTDALDDQLLNGDNSGANLHGILPQLTAVSDPSNTAVFDDFISTAAGAIDGIWSGRMTEVGMLVGPETYRLAARSFRDSAPPDSSKRGDAAAADYLQQHIGSFRTNGRMPASASSVQKGIIVRMGRPELRRAVAAHWNTIQIDDVYSGSASGERYLTLHVLVGDVLIVQAGAYLECRFKVS